MTFGEKLKEARTASGLKQSDLARILKTTNTTISNWENNVSKPDLDMLALICGTLNLSASHFLEARLPENEVSIPEFELIKKYRSLDIHGKEMVDMVLEKEHERSTSNLVQFPDALYADHLTVNAAHTRTDIEIPEGADNTDDKFMDNDDLWK